MTKYLSRDEILKWKETITTDDYSGNEIMDVVTVEDILDVEPADVVERSKIDEAIKEMKALVDPRNTILGFYEKMGLKVAINILLRNSGYAPDMNVGSKKG